MSRTQLSLGLVEQPKLVSHQISKWLHAIKQGVLRDGESWGSALISEQATQLLPLVIELGDATGWNKQDNDPDSSRRIICCSCRPAAYVTALSHLRWLGVCRETMVRQMNESEFTELQREKAKWPSNVRCAVQATEELEEWLYQNPEWRR